jgi:hypothetical protein
VYSWIWRHIPFKRWQLKALVSLALAAGVGALLWYQVFPVVEPILPFDDVQVETTDPGADTTIESPSPRSPTSPAPPTGPTGKSPAPAITSKAPPVVLPS